MIRRLGRVLAVRLDSDGDVLLTGPAIRALASAAESVDLLCSPAGSAAGRLLPGVRDVLTFAAPWSGFAPPPVDAPAEIGRAHV
jgi:heptosyltransferase-3